MNPDFKKLESISKSFVSELSDASAGKRTSLSYIVNEVPTLSFAEEGEVYQVLIIGGSIFKKALIKRQGDNYVIIDKESKYQPPFKHKKDFDRFVEREVSEKVNKIALNFAYPLKPVFDEGKLDGVLLSGMKENVFDELVGKKVGLEIEKYLFAKRKRKFKVAVANDTICLLLAGLTRLKWDDLVGGVIGTGMNFAFFLSGNKLVNLESANFDKFPQTPEAKLIDVHSADPGKGIFEKEVSGAYLYKHFNLINEAKGLNLPSLRSTQELDQIAHLNGSEEAIIARTLLTNSASLVAAQIAGIMEFKKKNMVFVIEGSLFWLSNGYRQQVKKVLAEISPKYKAKFVKIPESTILGAAKLIA